MTTEEQDRLCREKGWPTITEQKKYWDSLPHEGQEIALFAEIKNTLEKLTQAVEGLLAITKYQQEQINAINKQV